MKTKQEVIREAYGDRWEKVKNHIGADGWVQNKGPINPFDIGFKDHEIETLGISLFWRPISLRYIEGNNGWRIVNSIEDLPKKEGWYIIYPKPMQYGPVAYFNPGEEVLAGQWMAVVTHWQPMPPTPCFGPDLI